MDGARIVVVGSHAPGFYFRVERPPVLGETVLGWDFHEPIDGGKGSNQAIAAARLTGAVSFVGCVGVDRYGDQAQRLLEDEGVDTTWLRRTKQRPTGVGVIMLDGSGAPAMVSTLGANEEVDPTLVVAALNSLPDARILLTQFEIPLDVSIEAANLARQRGLTSIINPAPVSGRTDGLEAANVLVPNELEAKTLLGIDLGNSVDSQELAFDLRKATGSGAVIVTLGSRGAVGCDHTGSWLIEAPKIDVRDASGAGDVFCGALAVGLTEGRDLRAAASGACLAASRSVMSPGTIPSFPYRKQVALDQRDQPGALAPSRVDPTPREAERPNEDIG